MRLQDCHAAQETARQLGKLEVLVAEALGVSMIYAAPSVAAQPAYLTLLHGLAHVGKPCCPLTT